MKGKGIKYLAWGYGDCSRAKIWIWAPHSQSLRLTIFRYMSSESPHPLWSRRFLDSFQLILTYQMSQSMTSRWPWWIFKKNWVGLLSQAKEKSCDRLIQPYACTFSLTQHFCHIRAPTPKDCASRSILQIFGPSKHIPEDLWIF